MSNTTSKEIDTKIIRRITTGTSWNLRRMILRMAGGYDVNPKRQHEGTAKGALSQRGLVNISPSGNLSLTKLGEKVAVCIWERYSSNVEIANPASFRPAADAAEADLEDVVEADLQKSVTALASSLEELHCKVDFLLDGFDFDIEIYREKRMKDKTERVTKVAPVETKVLISNMPFSGMRR